MALNKYVLTANVTIAAGTLATAVAGEPATGGVSGFGNAETAIGQAGALWPTSYISGTAIVLDPAGPLFTAIGAGNLRLFTDGTDTVGHAALAN